MKKTFNIRLSKRYVMSYLGYLQQHQALIMLYITIYYILYIIICNSTARPGLRTSTDRTIRTTFCIVFTYYDVITYYTYYIYIKLTSTWFSSSAGSNHSTRIGYLRFDVNILSPTAAVVGLVVLYGAQLSDDRRRMSRKHQKPIIL